MLIDLGTNGETCGATRISDGLACSDGPAFLGRRYLLRLRATDGALDACRNVKETMEPEYSVIGGESPSGLRLGTHRRNSRAFRTGVISGKASSCVKESG
jgi:uncharacterized 2Fe-2S/4Fe-4S cluster protein (DUF4445 family)